MFVREITEDFFTNDIRVQKPDFPAIEQVNSPSGRYYVCPEGKRLPSMTTVISLNSRDGIAQWKKRVGEKEAARVSREAANRGTSVHNMMETYLLRDAGLLTRQLRRAVPTAQVNFYGLREYVDKHITDVRGLEARMFSRKLRMAGTADLIAMHDGELAVLDFKTSAKLKQEKYIDGYYMQCDGYAEMWEELTGEKPTKKVLMIATDAQREPQIFEKPIGTHLRPLKDLRLQFFQENGY